MRRRAAGLGLVGALALALAGCGELGPFPPADAGRACVIDSECVPNGCCGRGSAAVHTSEGPDCTSVFCDGQCPQSQVACGCGLPVCRDSRCAVAWSPEPACE